MDSAPQDIFRKTVTLARLGALEGDLIEDVGRTLASFRGLTELEPEGPDPVPGAARVEDATRTDAPRDGLPRERVLGCAPDARDGFFAVPRVLGGDA